jgi:regulation of enolase protein 1 (concanavalin A-like superfamily)
MSGRRSILLPILLASVLAGAAMPGEQGEVLEIKGWGRVIDPDGDCKFSIEKGRVAVAIPGTVHALSAERGQTNAPRILREVEGDFIAQVKVSGVCPPRSSSLVPARRPFRAAGLLIWLDAGNYIRLGQAGMVFDGKNLTYANFESRKDRRFERVGDASEHPLDGEETYLRLERRGGTVIASVSPDGTRWTTLKPLPLDMPSRVQIGIASTHNTSSPFEPWFEGFKLYQETKDVR